MSDRTFQLNAYLIAILFVVKTRAGPRLVFHHPPNSTPSNRSSGRARQISEEVDEDAELWYDSPDRVGYREGEPSAARSRGGGGGGGRNQDKGDQRDIEGRELDSVLGFGVEDIARMLCPTNRAFNKKRFELRMDQLVFLGQPRFANLDGSWSSKSKEKGNMRSSRERGQAGEGLSGSLHMAEEEQETSASEGDSEIESTLSSSDGLDLAMFNVVLVLNPPPLEHRIRIRAMYRHIVKPFSKALKQEHRRTGYVRREAEHLLESRDRAKAHNTCTKAASSSTPSSCSLAGAIEQLFVAISEFKIAHVRLSGSKGLSLQIPQPVSTSLAPTPAAPQRPGLWLTTAKLIETYDSSTALSPHAALLLLEDPESLLKDTAQDGTPGKDILIALVKHYNPRKSIAKVAAGSQGELSLEELQLISGQLIYWRKALAISPLKARDTYIVSPNCDLQALQKAMLVFARCFPNTRSLTNMLAELTDVKPWGQHIPSSDHFGTYMDILAWLVKGGWVCLLRKFAHVRVNPGVKAEVETARQAATTPLFPETEPSFPKRDPKSPHMKPVRTASPLHDSTSFIAGSSATNSTVRQSFERPIDSANKSATKVRADKFTSSIVIEPAKANADEAAWLSCIREAFLQPPGLEGAPNIIRRPRPSTSFDSLGSTAAGRSSERLQHTATNGPRATPEELYELWPTLLPYFDGRHALDDIAPRRG